MIVKVDQKQARECYAESLKVAPYPPTREPTKPNSIATGDTQVMSVDGGSPIQAMIVYQASLDDIFDVDLCDNTTERGPNPIEEHIKLYLRPKPRKCTQLSQDVTSHEHKRIVDVLHKNTNLFTWQPSQIPVIHPSIICHKLTICL